MYIILTPMHGTGSASDCDTQFLKDQDVLKQWLKDEVEEREGALELLDALPLNQYGQFEWATENQVLIFKAFPLKIVPKQVVTRYEIEDEQIPF